MSRCGGDTESERSPLAPSGPGDSRADTQLCRVLKRRDASQLRGTWLSPWATPATLASFLGTLADSLPSERKVWHGRCPGSPRSDRRGSALWGSWNILSIPLGAGSRNRGRGQRDGLQPLTDWAPPDFPAPPPAASPHTRVLGAGALHTPHACPGFWVSHAGSTQPAGALVPP